MIGKREKIARPALRAPLEYSQMLLRFLDIQGTLTHEKTWHTGTCPQLGLDEFIVGIHP